MRLHLKSTFITALALPASAYAVEAKKALEMTSPVSTSSVFQVVIGLMVVLLIIGASAFMLRRFGRLSSFENGTLKILATLSMGPRDKIVLLQAGEKQILVGLTPGRMQTLCELDEPIEISETDAKGMHGFQETIVSAFKNHTPGNKH